MTREPPICIGKPIIQTLAKEGAWQSANGNAVIAADELFHNDPYAEIERLTADNRRLENEIADMALGPTMVQNQRAEVERLRKDNLHWEHQNGLLEDGIERLYADLGRRRVALANAETEVERLYETDRLREVAFQAYADQEKKDRAEVERLRAALTEYAKGDNWLREARFDPNSHRFDGISFAMAALEPKP